MDPVRATIDAWLKESTAMLKRLDELLAPGDIETFMQHDAIVREWRAHRDALFLALGVAAADGSRRARVQSFAPGQTWCALPTGLHLVDVQADGAVAWVETEDDGGLAVEIVAERNLAPALVQLRQLRGRVRGPVPATPTS
jgi:hypothetical protein